MFPEKKSNDLMDTLYNQKLYKKLIVQLNKDFQMANIRVQFPVTIASNHLIEKLSKEVLNIFKNEYDSYLNLIYRIDVSEKDLLLLDVNSKNLITDITFLILKREAQKVWFKSKF